MAVAKLAQVAAATALGPDTRLLDLEMADGLPLGFISGQYVIVDSGLILPNGKAAKRAYSILSAEAEQRRFQLAVMRIPGGLASGFMHEVSVGQSVSFSGPWGKFSPPEGATGASLVLATDTGITAAVGLIQGMRFAHLLGSTTFIWLRTTADYFLPESVVREYLPRELRETRIAAIPSIEHPERVPYVRTLLREVMNRTPLQRAFISGDGTVNYALLDDLVAGGVPATRDSVESFFNMPKKSV